MFIGILPSSSHFSKTFQWRTDLNQALGTIFSKICTVVIKLKHALYWQARLAGLQDEVLEITMSLADLRTRQETAKDEEATIALEISRREADKREKMVHFKKDPRMCARRAITSNALCCSNMFTSPFHWWVFWLNQTRQF